jgi:hypothetical protein
MTVAAVQQAIRLIATSLATLDKRAELEAQPIETISGETRHSHASNYS